MFDPDEPKHVRYEQIRRFYKDESNGNIFIFFRTGNNLVRRRAIFLRGADRVEVNFTNIEDTNARCSELEGNANPRIAASELVDWVPRIHQ